MQRSSALNEKLNKCKGGSISNKRETRTISISCRPGVRNLTKSKSVDQDGTYLVKKWLPTNLWEHEAAKKAICRNGIPESLQCNPLLSQSMKQLAILFGSDVRKIIFNVILDQFDGLPIPPNDACHCKLQFPSLTYCSGYLPPSQWNWKFGSALLFLEKSSNLKACDRKHALSQLSGRWAWLYYNGE